MRRRSGGQDEETSVGVICHDDQDAGSGDVHDWIIRVVPRRRLSDLFRRRTATAGEAD